MLQLRFLNSDEIQQKATSITLLQSFAPLINIKAARQIRSTRIHLKYDVITEDSS